MKFINPSFFLFIAFSLLASPSIGKEKDTIYTYYSSNDQVTKKRKANYYTKTFKNSDGTIGVLEFTSYMNRPRMSGSYKTMNKKVKHGYFIYYIYGLKSEEGAYVNDQKEGIWKKWKKGTDLLEIGTYKNGIKDGEWKTWDNYGNLSMQATYAMGNLVGEYSQWEHGKLIVHGHYEDSLKIGDWEWFYSSGAKLKKGSYEKGIEIGEWYAWHENGQLKYKERYENGKIDGDWHSYHEDGSNSTIGQYEKGKHIGEWNSWYDNGEKNYTGSYENGKKVGVWMYYFYSGSLASKEVYENDEMIKVNWYNQDGSDKPYNPKDSLIEPSFSGGESAMMTYIMEEIEYPQLSVEMGDQGIVYVQFIVERNGSIDHVKVIRSVTTELDNEAKRVIEAMPKWQPGYQHNRPVRVRYTLPIIFRLG